MVCNSTEERKIKGNGLEGRGGDNDGEGEVRDFSGAKGDGVRQLDKISGPLPVGVPGGESCRGSNVAGGGTDSQGE